MYEHNEKDIKRRLRINSCMTLKYEVLGCTLSMVFYTVTVRTILHNIFTVESDDGPVIEIRAFGFRKKYFDSIRFSETNRFFFRFDSAHHCRICV